MSPPASLMASQALGLGPAPDPLAHPAEALDPSRQQDPVSDQDHEYRSPALGTYTNHAALTGQQTDGRPEFEGYRSPGRPARWTFAGFMPPPQAPPGRVLGIELTPTVAFSSAVSLSNGDPHRGNSYRMPPRPWDSALYTSVGVEGGVAGDMVS